MTTKRGKLVFPYGPNLTVASIEERVRSNPHITQGLLEQEYKRKPQPRYALIQWLKRHRLHNPTVRVIHKP